MNVLGVAAVACVVFVAVTCFKVWRIVGRLVPIAARELTEAKRERDSYGDALAELLAGLTAVDRGDLDRIDAAIISAEAALDGHGYTGRLRAAQLALEEAEDEIRILRASCGDEIGELL